ncbi:hypothetical protein [Escherichia coli]|uniref:hypothetical protein n=1 Tax=Escherichia coli TaxID=562 RepID=UPI0002A334E4|nr:hypothetical protein [Escherichia coli]ELC54480.1 hypothetical protein WGI_05106 [Escherichia coli KTE44]
MLEDVLNIEIEDIMEWIEQPQENGHIQLQSFTWKFHTFTYKGDRGVGVINYEKAPKHEMVFEDWLQALEAVKQITLNANQQSV